MDRIDYTLHESQQQTRSVDRHTAIGAIPFAGRDAEISGLVAAYHEAYSGARLVAVISGEMGSGKTRMLDEFCQHPELQRSFIIHLRVYGDDCHQDLRIVRDAVLDALEARPTLRRHIENALGIGTLARDREMPLTRILDLLARRVPLVLAIDNMESAGEECYHALGSALSEIDHSLLIVATTTPSTVARIVNFSRSIEAETVEVRLAPLGREAFALHLSDLFAIEPSPEDLDWMVEVTRGLPVLLREALNALLRTGCIVRRTEGWQQAHPFTRSRFTPLDALPLLKWRLAHLEESDRRILATIALMGNRVPRPVLTELGIVLDSYAVLNSHDFLRITGHYVEFTHHLLFDAAFAEAQSMGLCGTMHAQLIRILESGAADRGIRLPQLTIRTLLEQSGGEQRLALLDILLRGAGKLADSGEYTTAAIYFTECRRWWPEIVARHSAGVVADWTIGYSYVLYNLGRTDQQQKLLYDFLDDIDTATVAPDVALRAAEALIALIEACSRTKRIDQAMALVEQAVDIIQRAPESDERRDLELRIQLRRGQVLEAADRDGEAAAIYRDILHRWDAAGFSASVFEAIIWLQNLVRGDEETAQLHLHIEQMLEVCEREERMRPAVQLRSILAMNLFAVGDYEQAESAMRTLITEARRYSLPRTESSAWSILAKIYAMRGDYAEALRLLERTIEIRWRVRSLAFWQLAVITKAQFLVSAGRDAEACDVLDVLEKDAIANARSYRRFVVEVCHSRIAVRAGRGAQERKRLAELRGLGGEEDFDGIDQLLFELEGDILLHAPKVTSAEARNYAQRVQRHLLDDEGDMSARMLTIVVIAAMGRAIPATSALRRTLPNDVDELIAAGLEVLRNWKKAGALHNVAAALGLLRLHASHIVDEATLAEFDSAVAATAGETPYRYLIRAFGRLRILDACGVEQGGRHFGTQKSDSKPRKMLAALVVAAVNNQGLSRERLVDMIWGEGTTNDSAANNFHVTLSGLRQVVGDAIDFDGASYALDTAKLRIDVLEFLALAERGMLADRQGRTFHAYDLLTEACELYSSEFLEGIYDEWSDRARDLLRGKGRSARLRLGEIALQRGEVDIVHTVVHALLMADATDEAAMQLRLAAFQAEGHRMMALREYEKFAELLAAEYGVTPSRPLRDLRDDIARQ